ncbi:MAG: HU family DNA-binding protein [Dysgonamonadaceae bacterium]|jgi:nucleoid DNA-binding protein|nr:HU family DNA-binding protein [Dysgonamonadaceae bacterium]
METNKKLNFQDLADLLAEKTSISKQDSESFLKELFAIIPESITEEEPVKLKNLGTFKLTLIQSRESVNVNTGEKIEIPSHYRLGFTPASTLKELVNKPFSHFENVLLNEGVSFDGIAEDTNTPDFEEEEQTEDRMEDKSTVIPVVEEITLSETTVEPDLSIVEVEDLKTNDINAATPEDKKTPEIVDTELISVVYPVLKTKETVEPRDFQSPKKKSKPNANLFVAAGIVAVIAITAFFLFHQKNANLRSQVAKHQQIEATSDVVEETPSVLPDTVAFRDQTPPETTAAIIPDTVTLTAGKTLRLIALDKFGSREFWVYIYLKNKDKIKNPNVIPIGTKFLLPDPSEYDIDADNPKSVAKAKEIGDEALKKFR